MDCPFEDKGGWPSPFVDELNIVGEVTIDDNVEEQHVGSLPPSIPVYPIVKCYGLSRLE